MQSKVYIAGVLLAMAVLRPAAAADPGWDSLSAPMSECYAIAAQAQGLSLSDVKAAGARPEDYPRTFATCERYARGLRSQFACAHVPETAPQSMCREFYAIPEAGRWREVAPRDALRLGFSGADVHLVETGLASTPQVLPGVAAVDVASPPSPETGLAAEATATTTAPAPLPAPKPAGPHVSWKPGITYVWWPSGNCKAKRGESCLTASQYRAACLAAGKKQAGDGIATIDWLPGTKSCLVTRKVNQVKFVPKTAHLQTRLAIGFALRADRLVPTQICTACGS